MQQGRKQKPIPNKLWIARKRAGYAQKWVAKLLGDRSVSLISEYENGRKLPSLRTALKLELIYQTPIAELYPVLYAELGEEITAARERWLPSRQHETTLTQAMTHNLRASVTKDSAGSREPALVQAKTCHTLVPRGSSPSPLAPAISESHSSKGKN